MRLLHYADAHLGQCLYGPTGSDGVEHRLREQGSVIDQINLLAVNESADLIVFSGDMVRDPNPSPTVNLLILRALLRAQRAGIPVVMVQGNHDHDGTGRAGALEPFADEGVLVCRDPGTHLSLDPCGDPLCIVVAIPYFRTAWLLSQHPHLSKEQANERGSELAAEMIDGLLAEAVALNATLADPVPVLGMVHHNVEGSKLSSGYETAGPGDLRIPLRALDRSEFDFVCCGHIHKRQQLAERVWYAGSPLPLDFGEERDRKGCILVKALRRGGPPPIVNEVDIPTRPFVTLDFNFELEDHPGDLAPVRQRLSLTPIPEYPSVKDAIVRVRYRCNRSQKPAISHNAITELLQEAGAWHLHSIQPELTDAGQVVRIEGLTSTSVDPLAAAEHYINARDDLKPHREGLLAKLTQLIEEDSTRAAAA